MFMFSFTYSLFIIFHLPISVLDEPNELTFVLSLLLMIATFISLNVVKDPFLKNKKTGI